MESIYHQGQLDDALSGADEHAPSFSRGLALMESAAAERERGLLIDDNRMLLGLMAENRATTMRLVRMEAERTKEARKRAAKLETDVECLRISRGVWRFIAVLPWIIFPVMWVVTR